MARNLILLSVASGSIGSSTHSSGSIHSSVYPDTTLSGYPVTNTISGDLADSWQYYQNGSLLDFPVWTILDLGEDKTVAEFELRGRSFLWEGGSCPQTFQISVSPDLGRGPLDGDFEIVWATSLPKPAQAAQEVRTIKDARGTRRPIQLVWTNSAKTAIVPQFARYVKVSVDSTWDSDSGYVGISEISVWGLVEVLTIITSDAEIDPPDPPPIYSDAQITITLVQKRKGTLPSNALLVWASGPTGPTVEEADTLARGYITYMREIAADAKIIDPGQEMPSNSSIAATETQTILSDASLKRTATFAMSAHIAFPGSGSLSLLEGEGYSLDLFEKRLYTYSIFETTSVGTIVNDLFTGEIIDINDVQPPYRYQNYDWSYDWVIRTFNKAIYLLSTRTGNTLDEVNAALFSTRELGHRFERGHVPRYHQYRLHVWASGSGDFEFHQFTIRGHVEHGSSKYHQALIQKPFLTTNVVNLDIPRTWEPDLGTAVLWPKDYIPGDANSDGRITGADFFKMSDVLFGGSTAPDTRTLDVTGDGSFTTADLVYLLNYISGSGPPPRVVPE